MIDSSRRIVLTTAAAAAATTTAPQAFAQVPQAGAPPGLPAGANGDVRGSLAACRASTGADRQ